mmetsp:Transcript_24383/g.53897  ORF Transcript_24383/g.53897 Transcript_24383/m.53897 type:complete len:103 (-) Transcript_24383:178-486(-)
MASQTIFQKAANFAHKATITGLVLYSGYAAYNLTGQVMEGASGNSKSETAVHPQAGFIDTIREKAKEEYAKYYDIDHREWYDKDDDSYLKKLPRPGKDYQEK